jgi:nucleoside-diphosphate-sugar epimerase
MHLLITGAAGYVGSALTARMLAAGTRVTAFDRLLFGAEALLPFSPHPLFRLVSGDVRDTQALAAAAAGADALVHLAAIVGEDACAVDDAAAWSINVDGTESALRAAKEAGVARFLFVSTCSNYGVAGPDEIANEDSKLTPLSRYAEAKVAAELLTKAESRVVSTIVRFGTICGVSARMRFDLLVSEMARAAVRGEPILLYKPEAWRPFLHLADAAAAVTCWAQAPIDAVAYRVFNVISENHQKRGLVEIAKRHYPDMSIGLTGGPADARDYRVDGTRIERELGFRPSRTVEQAFCETADAVATGVFRDPSSPIHSAVPPSRVALHQIAASAIIG